MAKRKQEEAPQGSAPWMNTFADLMNLLLCFFVLLFSMSTVDAQKFELIAASFSQTFSVFSAGTTSIGEGALIANGISQLTELDNYMNSVGKAADNNQISDKLDELQNELETEGLKQSEAMAEKVEEALAENQMNHEVDMEVTAQYVQLTMKGALLFSSGSDELRAEALPVLDKVGVILERYAAGTIEIEGHTDNIPINSAKYASNEELSSARALSVFYYLADTTVLNPTTLKHAGMGERVPIAENSTEEGRSKNRRVEIKIFNPS